MYSVVYCIFRYRGGVYYFCALPSMLVPRETIIYRGRKAAKSLLKLPGMKITRDAR